VVGGARFLRFDKLPKTEQKLNMNEDLQSRIQTLAQWLYEAKYPVVFTGAGISTESGISDFRGPDGVWTRRDRGLPPKPMTRSWDSIEPNSGHLAIVELQKLGKLKFLISQNVDNLHLKSGIRPDLLAELHGNRNKLRCVRCDETVDRSEGQTHRGCGGELVMINQGETPFDGVTNLRFHESIGEVLPKAVKRLKRLMGFFE